MFGLPVEMHWLVQAAQFRRIARLHAFMNGVEAAEPAEAAALRRIAAEQADIVRHPHGKGIVYLPAAFTLEDELIMDYEKAMEEVNEAIEQVNDGSININ